MLINVGRLLMLCIWAFLLMNIIHPFPKPMKYFLDVAMVFMFFMHGLQIMLLKATQGKEQNKIGGWLQLRIFLFGVFELLAWQKKQPPLPPRK
jgi:putative membrane protein